MYTHIASKVDRGEHGADITPKAIDDSLKNLGLGLYRKLTYIYHGAFSRAHIGYIDLMLAHSPLSGPKNRLEAWKAFVVARNQGKVHNIGVSN